MGCRTNKSVISCMAMTLKSMEPSYIYKLEDNDPQLLSIKQLANKFESKVFYDITLLSALVAYRLRGSGETYWSDLVRMSDASLNSPYDIVKNFLKSRRELAIRGKFSRLKKLEYSNFSLIKNLPDYKDNPKKLYDELKELLKGRGEKTLSFAVKIFYYSVLAMENYRIELPLDIPLPVDSRVIKVSRAIGLINSSCNERKKISDAWNEISVITNISPLHIDSYIWLKLFKSLYKKGND